MNEYKSHNEWTTEQVSKQKNNEHTNEQRSMNIWLSKKLIQN